MEPSIARIVHWESPIYGPVPALITAVHDETVSLTTFEPGLPPYCVSAPYSEEPERYHWSWPPRI